MADSTRKTGADRKLVSLEEDDEVLYWMQTLGCTEAELREAVETIGRSADEVRAYLSKA